MSVQRRFRTGPPWLLPAILALIVVLIVLGFIFRSRLTSSSSSPTATPAIVTATPSGQGSTPGPGTAIPPSATPGANSGASTPVPNATPVPTVVGLQLGEITHKQTDVSTAQSGADRKDPKFLYYLDPRQVVQNNLAHYGFTKGFQIVSPNPSPTPTPHSGAQDKRPQIDFVVSYGGKEYTVVTAQPAKTGPSGIWLIVTILQGRQSP